MEQNTFKKILNILYPHLKIVNYTLFERFEVGENGEFGNKIAPAIFVEVVGESEITHIGADMTRMTGLDVVVDKFN